MTTGVSVEGKGAGMQRGFTLIELLIVVLIIAILAAIALPNFLEFQTRAKIARAQSDMRTMTIALEAYAVDEGTYPMDASGPPYQGFLVLTTPIAYVSTTFRDPFNHAIIDGRTHQQVLVLPDNQLLYQMSAGSSKETGIDFPADVYVIASYGPDREDDTHQIGDFPFTRIATPYDPTNGSVSDGDLYRFGPHGLRVTNYLTDANPETF